MSVSYRAVQWNRHKRVYDGLIIAVIAIFISAYILISILGKKEIERISLPILLMRATSTCSFVLLNLILCIGPLCRIDKRFLPLLYNRRHLGVSMFLLALLHGLISIVFYHGFGKYLAFDSLIRSNQNYVSLIAFPFETLGVGALTILFFMAATSHDFWLKFLTPRIWKSLHMMVYMAYVLIIGHIALGVLQSEKSDLYVLLLILTIATVCALHIIAASKVIKKDRVSINEWIEAGNLEELRENQGKVICGRHERIAIYRWGNRISAMSNLCAHQGGPIGEGRIINGCITCPWHGYQYQPQDACSPPPFTEKIPTYQVRIRSGKVYVNTIPLASGTDVSIEIEDTSNE